MSAAATRPHVQVNCATSADGRLAFAEGRRAILSGPEDLARVQALRAGCDAILVGVATVRLDDPSLRVHWDLLHRSPGKEPLRVVLDSRGRTPEHAKVLDGRSPTLIATSVACSRKFPNGVDAFAAGTDRVDLPALLTELRRRGIRRLLVEGGGEVIASFLRAGLVDLLTVYVAPVLIGGATAPSMMRGAETSDEATAVKLRLLTVDRLGPGVLLSWAPPTGGHA
ncbi:MAG TPA: dihydrofolate reductase family protein [Thermoplasmata archaeon]|nr:dihydrofolate reductase family protein [Thermoplasmata archaeon]